MLFRENNYAWFLLMFLWVFGFVGSLGRFVMAYYQQDITETLGVGRGFLGFTWSTATFLGAVTAPLGGWLIDRIGYKKVMLIVGTLNLLSIGVVLTLRNPIGYFVGFGCIAGLAGVGASVNYVLVANWFRYHRAKALTIIGSAGSLGLAVLTPILVHLQHKVHWVVIYQFLFVVSCVFIPLIGWVVRTNTKDTGTLEGDVSDSRSRPDQTKKSRATISAETFVAGLKATSDYVRNPVLLIVMVALLTCGISMGTVEMHLMAIHQLAGVPSIMQSSALSLLGILEIVGGLTFSILLDYMTRTKALAFLYGIRAAAFIVLLVHAPFSPFLFSFLFGATYLGAVPGGILVAGEALKGQGKSIGLHTGILLFIHQLGGAIAAWAGGVNYDHSHNYQTLIAVNVILSLVVSAGYAFAVRRQRSVFPQTSDQKEAGVI